MEAKAKRLRKYSGISLGAVIVMAFILVQPTIQTASAVGVEGLPGYDTCTFLKQPEDRISMNTVRSGSIVKTIHAEKEIFSCFLDQGSLSVGVDVTTYIEMYENIDDRKVIHASALVTTCIKEPSSFPNHFGGATVIDCESYIPSSNPVPVGTECGETNNVEITHPQEMNTVIKGRIAKTIEAQKEVFECNDINGSGTFKKVDIVLFTEIYEDLNTQTVIDIQFHSMRCVVLTDDSSDDRRDATVETCQFSTIQD